MNRRRLLGLTVVAAVACLGFGLVLWAGEAPPPPAAKPILTFGVVTDVQYADIPTQGKRQFRESLPKLERCVADFNKRKPEFVIHIGDTVNEGFANYDALLPFFERLSMPRYMVLGNHDVAVEAGNRSKILARLGLDKLGSGKGYYDFARAGWRFAVLNGNDISVVGSVPGGPERKAADALVADLKKKGARNAGMYNGAVGPQQLAWLKETLAKADAAGERAIVFCHFPVYPPGGSNLWNDTEVLGILEAHKCVAAFFCGHVHGGGYAQKGSLHFVTFKGLVEADPTAYALVEVFADSLKITGFGAEKSRELKFNAAAVAPAAR